jgi:hypothetical protein
VNEFNHQPFQSARIIKSVFTASVLNSEVYVPAKPPLVVEIGLVSYFQSM